MGFLEYVVSDRESQSKLWCHLPETDLLYVVNMLEKFAAYCTEMGYMDMITSFMISYDHPCVMVLFIDKDTESEDICDLADMLIRWSNTNKIMLGHSGVSYHGKRWKDLGAMGVGPWQVIPEAPWFLEP